MTPVVRQENVASPVWRTGSASTGSRAAGTIPGVVASIGLPSPDYTAYTFAISSVNTLPGSLEILNAANTGFTILDPVSKPSLGPINTPATMIPVLVEFGALGTYVVDITFGATHKATSTTYNDTGRYTFHVGPVAELEVKAAWNAPGVFTLTAVNHGPNEAPAARVTVTPPPGLRFVRSEASEGSYDPNSGVWNIGALEDLGYYRALSGREGATLTIHTEPRRGDPSVVNAPNQRITASIENTQDYCVRIKTGGTFNDDLECDGSPVPSGYTQHSTEYYDHRPDNNRVALPADWTGVPFADTRLTGLAFTSGGSYQAGDDIEATASFSQPVTVAGHPQVRLRVGAATREAAMHSHSGKTIVFRYRVQEADSPVDGISIPPNPFILPSGADIRGPGGGRVLLLFDGSATVYPAVAEPVPGSSAPAWSPAAALDTGAEGARYQDFDGMRHYYRYSDLTRRWEIEFRIADAGLEDPDEDLLQWLVLRTSGYYVARPHIYGAARMEMKPYLGDWGHDRERYQQQICIGLKAEFSPGKTRGQRLEELRNVKIEWLDASDDDGVRQSQGVESLLRSARSTAAEAPCPEPPTGVVTIQGQASTGGTLGAVLSDPNGVNEDSVNWQWKRSPEGTTRQNVGYTGFSDITGATGPSYAPGDDDAGRWLRVKASYRDGQRQTRSAWGQVADPVPGAADQQQQPQPPAAVADIAPQTVAADWPLIPAGVGPGDSFRLLFVTSATTTAESADIAGYNGFVRAAADGNDNLKPFKDEFSALVSTAGVNIKGNSATVGAGAPVHWLAGDKVANDYADFYDLSWDSVSGTTETGGSYTGLVWTGSNGRGETSLRSYAGAAQVRMGDLGGARPLSSPTARAATESYPLYALSPVITVAGGADRQGMVWLGTETPRAGSALTAVLLDPDGVTPGSLAWQWQRSPEGTTAQSVDTAGFEDISGATGETYTPVEGDAGRWLRVRAAYADGHGPGKTAQARTDNPVAGQGQRQQAAAAVTALGMHSSGPYGAGDAISVAVAFSRDVTVAGTPTLSIEVGGSPRAALYQPALGGGAVRVFSYAVSGGDEDGDGVSVYPGSITLPQGASITDSGGNDVLLALAGLPPQPGHTVDAPQQQAANNEPEFTLDSDARSVDENAAPGSNVGSPVTADDDDDGDALTYALSGSGAFAIDASSGQLTVAGALDHETQSSYSLTVSVSDGKNAAGEADSGVDDTIAITVNVGNVDEAGTVTLDPETPQAGSPLTASLNDPDGGESGVAWSWESSADGTNWTAVDGASGASYTPPADDVGKYLRATASYADGHGSGKAAQARTASAVAAAQQQPEPPASDAPAITAGPVITSSPASGDTYGNGEAIVAAVTFSEAVTVSGEPRVRLDVGERKRWARYDRSSEDGTVLVFAYLVRKVDADGDGVSIGADQLGLNRGSIEDADGNAAGLAHPALATQSGHKVDGSLEQQPAQQQQAANNEPQFALDSANLSVNEDAAVGSNVGSPVTATDGDGDALTYALTGSGAFAIDASTGQITVQGALDYETQSSYALTVSVSDGKDASGGDNTAVDDTIAMTVSVGNVDEAGTVTLDPETPQAGSPLTASLNDPDGGVSALTWAWEISADGTNWTAIGGAGGASYTPSDDDVRSYLRATASYGDGHGSGKSALAATASAVEAAPAAQQQQAPTVPADSPLVPTGLGPGDSFRLLFVTSTSVKAESADIADYNGFAQARAAANTNLADFSGRFRALISTAGVNIKDNSATTGTGVPVHWLGGEKVADDYADFYDLSWDSVSGKTESGGSYTGLVWTGSNGRGETSQRSYAGAAQVRMGDLGDGRPLSSPTAKASSESYPLYALSPVITVAQPE